MAAIRRLRLMRCARYFSVVLCLLQPVSPKLAFASEGGFGQTGTTLSGRITQTEGGQPLSGALVVIDELRLEVRAGEDGSYRFENVPPGNYHVGIRAEGYSTRRTEVTVGTTPKELNISIDFDMHFAEVLSVSPTARPQFESVPTDHGARRPGADQESRSDDRRHLVRIARRRDA